MEYKDTLQLVDAVKLLKKYEKEQNISLFNPKALQGLATLITKVEKEQQMQRYLDTQLEHRIAPLEAKITQLLNQLQPPITLQQPETKPIMNIPQSDKSPTESNGKLWTEIENTEEKQVLECANGHKLNIIKSNNMMIANIDDMENHNIKNNKDLEELKKKVENMKPYS